MSDITIIPTKQWVRHRVHLGNPPSPAGGGTPCVRKCTPRLGEAGHPACRPNWPDVSDLLSERPQTSARGYRHAARGV